MYSSVTVKNPALILTNNFTLRPKTLKELMFNTQTEADCPWQLVEAGFRIIEKAVNAYFTRITIII
jgi:hypothetical protein